VVCWAAGWLLRVFARRALWCVVGRFFSLVPLVVFVPGVAALGQQGSVVVLVVAKEINSRVLGCTFLGYRAGRAWRVNGFPCLWVHLG